MLTINEMHKALGNSLHSFIPEGFGGLRPNAVRIDSRAILQGDMFVAIAGEQVDGHSFAEQAVKNGAIVILAEREVFGGQPAPVAVLMVEDSVKAMGVLANAYRAKVSASVVGITGTAGKTSVKEALAEVLSCRGKTAKNKLNLNNQIGLPLSMLNAGVDSEFWVMEAGISEAHDMDELGAILEPDIALVLNVGAGHLSGLGDKGVAYYKSQLFKYLSGKVSGLVNADYPELVKEAKTHGKPLKFFSSQNPDVDFYSVYLRPEGSTQGRYLVRVREVVANGAAAELPNYNSYEVIAPFRGSFGAENVAAIAGVAHLLGLEPYEVRTGLASAVLPQQRFACESSGNFILVDDSYNANPLSCSRMLESAAEIAKDAGLPLVLVMGEMLELGEETAAAHTVLGTQMNLAAPVTVFWKGGRGQEVQAGINNSNIPFIALDNAESFRKFTATLPQGGAVFLVKGSRGNRLEKISAEIRSTFLADAKA